MALVRQLQTNPKEQSQNLMSMPQQYHHSASRTPSGQVHKYKNFPPAARPLPVQTKKLARVIDGPESAQAVGGGSCDLMGCMSRDLTCLRHSQTGTCNTTESSEMQMPIKNVSYLSYL